MKNIKCFSGSSLLQINACLRERTLYDANDIVYGSGSVRTGTRSI